MNRQLLAIMECSQVLVHSADEQTLLNEICRIIVKVGGYRMAWVGMAEQDEARSVRPVAQAGYERGYLKEARISWAETERGRGPTGTAIRTGVYSVCRDMRTDPLFVPWRARALTRGYAAMIVMPLMSQGQVFGALSIYSDKAGDFAQDEVGLLTQLANDLAYGIVALRTRGGHSKAEAELQQYRQGLEELVEQRTAELRRANSQLQVQIAEREQIEVERDRLFTQSLDMLVVAGFDGYTRRINPAFQRVTGFTAEELYARPFLEFAHPDDRQEVATRVSMVAQGKDVPNLEVRLLCKDGTYRDMAWSARGVPPGSRFFNVIGRDITDFKRAGQELRYLVAHARCILWHAWICALPGWRDGPVEDNHGLQWDVQIQDTRAAQEMLPLDVPEGYNYFQAMAMRRHPDEQPRMRANALAALRAGKRHYSQDYRCYDKFGQELWFNENVQLEPVGQDQWRGFGVVIDITQRKRAEETAIKQQEMLRNLASELSRSEEQERRRIAVLLHDQIAQTMALAQMKLEVFKASSPPDQVLLDEALGLLEQSINDTRTLTCQLSPPVLYELGLEAAIGWLAEQSRQTHGLAVAVHNEGLPESLSQELRSLLFQGVRELIVNVAKHARARNVNIRMNRQGNDLNITVEDDGVGFDESSIWSRTRTDCYGLFNIRQRLQQHGGRLEIQSSAGHGARLTLVVAHDSRGTG